jgi:hypothetical protein
MSDTHPATALQSSYNLIEDYVQTLLPPVAQTVANCFHAVQNDSGPAPITELLTVSADNHFLRFFRDAASNSGWNHEEAIVDGAPAAPIREHLARGRHSVQQMQFGSDGSQQIIVEVF